MRETDAHLDLLILISVPTALSCRSIASPVSATPDAAAAPDNRPERRGYVGLLKVEEPLARTRSPGTPPPLVAGNPGIIRGQREWDMSPPFSGRAEAGVRQMRATVPSLTHEGLPVLSRSSPPVVGRPNTCSLKLLQGCRIRDRVSRPRSCPRRLSGRSSSSIRRWTPGGLVIWSVYGDRVALNRRRVCVAGRLAVPEPGHTLWGWVIRWRPCEGP